MPFGLTNAPATFMRTMSNMFADILDDRVVAFLDDVLLYSNTLEEHVALLKKAFDRLRKYHFYCKLKKCAFFLKQTTFLGFDISENSISINKNELDAVISWPAPTNLQQV